MHRLVPLLAVLAVGLNGCSAAAPKGAVESATRLLAAVLSGDRVAFEAQIDRAAVRDDVRRQVAEIAKGSTLDVEGGPSEFALDRMIGPDAVRVLGPSGVEPAAPPTPAELAPLMRKMDGKRACLREADGDNCVLTFAKGKDHWRLVGMRAMDATVQLAGD